MVVKTVSDTSAALLVVDKYSVEDSPIFRVVDSLDVSSVPKPDVSGNSDPGIFSFGVVSTELCTSGEIVVKVARVVCCSTFTVVTSSPVSASNPTDGIDDVVSESMELNTSGVIVVKVA